MCACQNGIVCPRCRDEFCFDLEVLSILPEPSSPAEEAEARTQEHHGRVVAPSLDGGK